MKKYFINQIELDSVSDWDHRVIGLFTDENWEGRGNFCGWYGSEFYTDTILVAYFVQHVSGNNPFNPKQPYEEFEVVNRYFKEVCIGSKYWTRVIEADTVEQAIEIFKNQCW